MMLLPIHRSTNVSTTGELASHRTGSASTVRLSMSSALSSAPSQVSGRFGIGAFEDADDIDVFDTDKCMWSSFTACFSVSACAEHASYTLEQ